MKVRLPLIIEVDEETWTRGMGFAPEELRRQGTRTAWVRRDDHT
jgi:hypothetical protein